MFKSSGEAVMFALRFSSQQYAQSAMAKQMKSAGRIGSGKGLVALDGAGQAGIIMRHVDALGELGRACVIARYTDRTQQCPCCNQTTASEEYRDAIIMLASWAHRTIPHVTDVPRLRFAIVQEFYERRRSVRKVAEEIGMAKSTAYDQRRRIWPQLDQLDKQALAQLDEQLLDLIELATV